MDDEDHVRRIEDVDDPSVPAVRRLADDEVLALPDPLRQGRLAWFTKNSASQRAMPWIAMRSVFQTFQRNSYTSLVFIKLFGVSTSP